MAAWLIYGATYPVVAHLRYGALCSDESFLRIPKSSRNRSYLDPGNS